ncbi:MAG TPA: SDR family NAD(P)-dependent oxidoreductase, partial [Solirubrobacteraceae bacterium]|nr:SDR family NAD(P)-dependent oxidoreductase [Solirubrobacteraceae bacterium]
MAKTVFITGASSGIGRALASELASRGYDLFLTARRADVLEQARSEIESAHPGRTVHVRELDVTDDAAVAAALEQAASALGRVDIVVANAGLELVGKPIADISEIDYDRLFAVNTKGVFFTLQQAAR